ncbi:MAG TPA: peroxiredoxin [Gammaproteobacteria bacterium]|nr:peroxiredoxin [Gammaproteobacteria bacterium]
MNDDKYFAPDFELLNQSNKIRTLNDLCDNSWLVLYFYPKDNTSGCTQQANDFKEYFTKFQKKNCNIIGVSKDSMKSHQNFVEKLQLPFDLLVDDTIETCTLYNVYKEKSMYGRKYMGIERSTFLISPDKEIVKAWRKTKVTNHVATVYDTLANVNL